MTAERIKRLRREISYLLKSDVWEFEFVTSLTQKHSLFI